jgi:RimJ/RimL family protein N-acetyltransferase
VSVLKTVRLVALGRDAMIALLDNDLERASDLAGMQLTDFYTSDVINWLWSIRVKQIETDPESEHWTASVVVDQTTGAAVGHAGFHAPPDANGLVEIGYSIDPLVRRQGYARATVVALLARCAAEPAVETVRATISPTNEASLATIADFGFTHVGEQIDDDDGLEYIFERPAKGSVAP